MTLQVPDSVKVYLTDGSGMWFNPKSSRVRMIDELADKRSGDEEQRMWVTAAGRHIIQSRDPLSLQKQRYLLAGPLSNEEAGHYWLIHQGYGNPGGNDADMEI